MITINGTEIAEHYEEYGILWTDGDEDWDLCEEDARDIAWQTTGTLIRKHVFISVTEVVECETKPSSPCVSS